MGRCDGGARKGRRQRSVVRGAEVEEQGPSGVGEKDRSVILEDSKKFLAMQKDLFDQVRELSSNPSCHSLLQTWLWRRSLRC